MYIVNVDSDVNRVSSVNYIVNVDSDVNRVSSVNYKVLYLTAKFLSGQK